MATVGGVGREVVARRTVPRRLAVGRR
jgi:hypothetical protein